MRARSVTMMPKHEYEHPAIVTERQKEEYDRFGPWAYSVKTSDEMPPRFDPWYEELKDSPLIIKMPCAVERRYAKPGSDLYERILAIARDGIVYLTLSQGEVSRQDIAIGDIAALRLVQDLLYGQLCIDLADGSSLSVLFNTVSADVFTSFVDALRMRLALGLESPRFAPVEQGPEPSEEDMLFGNLLKTMRERVAALALLAYQGPCILEPTEAKRHGIAGFVTRLLHWRLDGCILAASPSEIIMFVRGTGIPRIGKLKGFRYETIYLPARPYQGVAVEARILPNGATIHALRISSSGHDYELFFERDPSCALSSL
jgi:hypothetical protein